MFCVLNWPLICLFTRINDGFNAAALHVMPCLDLQKLFTEVHNQTRYREIVYLRLHASFTKTLRISITRGTGNTH